MKIRFLTHSRHPQKNSFPSSSRSQTAGASNLPLLKYFQLSPWATPRHPACVEFCFLPRLASCSTPAPPEWLSIFTVLLSSCANLLFAGWRHRGPPCLSLPQSATSQDRRVPWECITSHVQPDFLKRNSITEFLRRQSGKYNFPSCYIYLGYHIQSGNWVSAQGCFKVTVIIAALTHYQ